MEPIEDDPPVAAVTAEEQPPVEEAEEIYEEDDEARAEATFKFVVKNFSEIKDTALSEPTIIRNLPWKIMIMQRQTQNQATSYINLFQYLPADSDYNAYAVLKSNMIDHYFVKEYNRFL